MAANYASKEWILRAHPTWRAVLWIAMLEAAGSGCGSDVATQIILQFDADEATIQRADALRLTYLSSDGPSETVTERLQGPDARLSFPVVSPISPRGGDATRRFGVLAELLDAEGNVFQTQRAIGGFERDAREYVYLRFESSCDGVVACGGEGSCVSGECVAACVDPTPVDDTANRTPFRRCANHDEGELFPLARYRINEAIAGQPRTDLVDDAADPIGLPIEYALGSPMFADDGSNRLLRFSGSPGSDTGGARLVAMGTKFEALNGAGAATLEVKYTVDECADTDYRILGVANGRTPPSSGLFEIRENTGSEFLAVRWSAFSGAASYRFDTDCPFAEPRSPAVVHWVVDTQQSIDEDRVRAYVDGERQTISPTSGIAAAQPYPPLGATLDLFGDESAPPVVALGTPAVESAVANARIWYAAFYGYALSDEQIRSQATTLALEDD